MTPPWETCRLAVAGLAARLRGTPWSLLAAAAVLLAFGWLGIHRFEEIHRESHFFLKRQIVWSALAFLVMGFIGFGPWRRIPAWSYPLYGLSFVLLIAVFAFPPINGAHRWIRLGPVGFQPSEPAKLAVVLAVARCLMTPVDHLSWRGLLVATALAGGVMLLVAIEPDLGTALVLVPVLGAMLFVGGAKKRQLAVLLLAGAAALPAVWTGMSREQRSRVTALFEAITPGVAPSADAYHLYQARRTFAFGGFLGSFFAGNAVDDLNAFPLPEGQGDFILCVVAERFGLLGVGVVFTACAFYVRAGLRIAQVTDDAFVRLAATGIVAVTAVQVVINAGMLAGLLPVTGLPFPFLSYGGSSLVVQGVFVGLLVLFQRQSGERGGTVRTA